jgi:hypothetical protein
VTQRHVAWDGSHRCYLTENGIDRTYVGCLHETPRAAIRHEANVAPYVSPLRFSGEGATVPATSSSETDVAPSPELRGTPGSRRRGRRP